MIKKIKCLFFGCLWQQKGYSVIKHFEKDYVGHKEYTHSITGFLFFCPRCFSFKEYQTKCYYEPVEKHEQAEVDI